VSDIADRGHETSRHSDVHSRNCDKSFDSRIAQNALCDFAVEQDQILSQAIELSHMTLDRRRLVGRQRLACEPPMEPQIHAPAT
jgi:hypothetical protein